MANKKPEQIGNLCILIVLLIFVNLIGYFGLVSEYETKNNLFIEDFSSTTFNNDFSVEIYCDGLEINIHYENEIIDFCEWFKENK